VPDDGDGGWLPTVRPRYTGGVRASPNRRRIRWWSDGICRQFQCDRHQGPAGPGPVAGNVRVMAATGIEVHDVPDRTRYEVTVDGRLAGFAAYRETQGVRVFTHTEVDDDYEGRGVGSALARGALDEARAAGRRIVALCPFIFAYISRHPEYADLIDDRMDRALRA
jgi:predicted GNAT family acetyltransferase